LVEGLFACGSGSFEKAIIRPRPQLIVKEHLNLLGIILLLLTGWEIYLKFLARNYDIFFPRKSQVTLRLLSTRYWNWPSESFDGSDQT
jgi:hypothetical protein